MFANPDGHFEKVMRKQLRFHVIRIRTSVSEQGMGRFSRKTSLL